ncbi:unnamed protein product, partial [Notodromas monacha]
MNLHMLTTILSFMDTYLLMDAVIPDLDDPQEILPPDMRWTMWDDSRITSEFQSLVHATGWKEERNSKAKLITIHSLWSKAYNRRIFKSTV